MDYSTLFMILGFLAAAYAIVANDAIQTLGTFISSNGKRPWWVLWMFSCTILGLVLVYGWFAYNGDVSYGRLGTKFPVPDTFTWVHAIPPFLIIILTRYGIPVSTTFLVLTVFAPTVLSKILMKSALGYLVAFVSGLIVYLLVSKIIESKFIKTNKEEVPSRWVVFQWISTGFLWSQWLIQDLANIFVYMPTRSLDLQTVLISLLVLFGLSGLIFYRRGGEIQGIVNEKTNTHDIRSATIVDFIYALILFFFKNMSDIPMSTTWVFIGLLAGRELGLTLRLNIRPSRGTFKLIFRDAGKAFVGLAVSVALALSLPFLQSL